MIPKFLITETVPDFFIRDLEMLGYSVDYLPEIKSNEIGKIINLYTGILIRSRIILDKQIIENGLNLKYILRPGSGLDIIDSETACAKGIKIVNSPEGNRDSVAEHATGLLFSLLNYIPRAFAEFQNWQWTRKQNIGHELMGKTIGIIGYGNTGSAFAERLSSFKIKILAYDKYKSGFTNNFVKETKPGEIFKEADILSLHIPQTKETLGLVNTNYIKKFQKPFYLINTSRGKIINTADLVKAIKSGFVLGAALDVIENEDIRTQTTTQRQNIIDLLNTNKVIITPHIAGLTEESEKKIFSNLIGKLLNSNI
jgi:D-3-phosphoglycerate dehydrogenase / 2-oxoglutarate reductase